MEPSHSNPPSPWSLAVEGIVRAFKAIRPEEWLLFALWLFGAGLCLASGTGFDFQVVFVRYLKFFATYALVLLISSRILFTLAEAWRPQGVWGQRLRRFAFGEQRGWVSIVAVDIEFARGMLLLFANLAVYSNIKVRIPALNPEIGDALFLAWDNALFGPDFAPKLEAYTRENPWFSRFLSNTYKHDYLWMIVLLWIGYLRRDLAALRWIFGATCLTYITAILVTVGYPSMGPFFMEPKRFDWVNDTGVGGAQRFLKKFYAQNLPALEKGERIAGRSFAGIAAFPSLHIGHMVVMGWAAIRLMPLYAVWMLVVTVVTFFATVAFGWHYAVDALGGAVLAIACTELVWQIVKRDTGRSRGWPLAPTPATQEDE